MVSTPGPRVGAASLRIAAARMLAYWLAGLVGLAAAQRVVAGHVNWSNLGGLAAGMLAGIGLLEILALALARARRDRH